MSGTVAVRLSTELLDQLKSYADSKGLTVSEAIRVGVARLTYEPRWPQEIPLSDVTSTPFSMKPAGTAPSTASTTTRPQAPEVGR